MDQVDATGMSDTVQWSVEFARRSGIGLWPAEDFGAAGHVRVAVTAPSETDWGVAVEALTESLKTGA